MYDYIQAFVLISIGVIIVVRRRLLTFLVVVPKSQEKMVKYLFLILGMCFIAGGLWSAIFGFSK